MNAFKAFGSPVYLAFHHEPENDVGSFGTPDEYAAVFRHVVDIFRSREVTNVAFVWTMMAWSFNQRSGQPLDTFYPGDAYVDFVGSDGYNWYPGRPGSSGWSSFADVFDATQSFALAHGKPWIAVETGVQEDPGVPATEVAGTPRRGV